METNITATTPFILRPDGTTETLVGSKLSGSLTLEQMQKAVGGYIETPASSPDGKLVMIVNEEGKLRGLPANIPATAIYHSWLGIPQGSLIDIIVGSVLIATPKQMGEEDDIEDEDGEDEDNG